MSDNIGFHSTDDEVNAMEENPLETLTKLAKSESKSHDIPLDINKNECAKMIVGKDELKLDERVPDHSLRQYEVFISEFKNVEKTTEFVEIKDRKVKLMNFWVEESEKEKGKRDYDKYTIEVDAIANLEDQLKKKPG